MDSEREREGKAAGNYTPWASCSVCWLYVQLHLHCNQSPRQEAGAPRVPKAAKEQKDLFSFYQISPLSPSARGHGDAMSLPKAIHR